MQTLNQLEPTNKRLLVTRVLQYGGFRFNLKLVLYQKVQ